MPTAETTPASPLPTMEPPDDLWEEIEPILDCFYPPARTGRPRADLRRMLDGIIHRLRSGCQWNQMPERFGELDRSLMVSAVFCGRLPGRAVGVSHRRVPGARGRLVGVAGR